MYNTSTASVFLLWKHAAWECFKFSIKWHRHFLLLPPFSSLPSLCAPVVTQSCLEIQLKFLCHPTSRIVPTIKTIFKSVDAVRKEKERRGGIETGKKRSWGRGKRADNNIIWIFELKICLTSIFKIITDITFTMIFLEFHIKTCWHL